MSWRQAAKRRKPFGKMMCSGKIGNASPLDALDPDIKTERFDRTPLSDAYMHETQRSAVVPIGAA